MRRTDREVSNMEDILSIIKKCDVCRLAFFDKEYPYIIPLNFGYSYENDELILYFHGARVGKKLELIDANNKVGFEMDCSHKLIERDNAGEYTMEYESVCGNGQIERLDKESKQFALTRLMRQYTDLENIHFSEKALDATEVLKLKVCNITGKRNMYKNK